MRSKQILRYAAFCFIISLFMTPQMYAQEPMEILNNIEISTTQRHEWYPSVEFNPTDNEFLVMWRTSGRDTETPTESSHSIDGRRVSTEGALLGAPIQLSPPELGFKTLPKAAHNIFANNYMVVFTQGIAYSGRKVQVAILDNEANIELGPDPLPDVVYYNNTHPAIVFNSGRQEYLIAYNDSWIGSPMDLDNFGFILDEEGTIEHGPFDIGSRGGIQFNPQPVYNSVDDTYLVNWEDFRGQVAWWDPTDIWGALLDSDGISLTAEDIPMVVDLNEPEGIQGDQRVQVLAYNPDKNESLVVWMDRIITEFYDPVGYATLPADIVGRIFRSDGTPKTKDFVIAGAAGNQSLPQLVYVKEREKYFMVWQDSRNSPPDLPYYMVEYDIYGKWLSPAGKPVGQDIPICTAEGSQTNPALDYSPAMDRFLITWRENNALGDDEPVGWCFGHICETVGDIKGAIFGVPAP